MWAHPGKQLLFMGGEMAQDREWSHDRSLDWHLLEHPSHAGVDKLLKSLNYLYKERPALWEQDFDWTGFSWIDANDTDQNVLSFLRYPADRDNGKPLACIANLSPVPREGYRIGVPQRRLVEGGAQHRRHRLLGQRRGQRRHCADGYGWHGHDQSLSLTLPPLAVVWLEPED